MEIGHCCPQIPPSSVNTIIAPTAEKDDDTATIIIIIMVAVVVIIVIIIFIFKVVITIIIITRPWPAFGRQGLVGSSFEYSYTHLALRLRRSAQSGIMTSLNTSRNFDVLLFLDNVEYGKCPETGELTKFFEYFKGFCTLYCF